MVSMPKVCDNTSVGQIILNDGEMAEETAIVIIERGNYPEAYALPAGHTDGDPEAVVRESSEEVGLTIIKNRLIFCKDIDNPCKREGGSHHVWQVYIAISKMEKLRAGSDAKSAFWASVYYLRMLARRTEYFMAKYGIPYTEVGALTKKIFGEDPNAKNTDPEWKNDMGLEPVWYYILKRTGFPT